MTTQFTTLIFVLLTFMSAECRLSYNKNRQLVFTQISSRFIPTNSNLEILGKAAGYSVLAGSRTLNEGETTLTGSLGVYPGTEIIGADIKIIDGGFHVADTSSGDAQADSTAAYIKLSDMTGALDMTGTDLGGLTVAPGDYHYTSSCLLSEGILTLDAKGDANAKWVFKIVSTLITGTNTKVVMINGGDPLNVYWIVGSSATMKAGTEMVGNILAYASISFGKYVSLRGRALARTAAVSMLSNTIKMDA